MVLVRLIIASNRSLSAFLIYVPTTLRTALASALALQQLEEKVSCKTLGKKFGGVNDFLIALRLHGRQVVWQAVGKCET